MNNEKTVAQEFLNSWVLPANAKIAFQNFLEAVNGINIAKQEIRYNKFRKLKSS